MNKPYEGPWWKPGPVDPAPEASAVECSCICGCKQDAGGRITKPGGLCSVCVIRMGRGDTEHGYTPSTQPTEPEVTVDEQIRAVTSNFHEVSPSDRKVFQAGRDSRKAVFKRMEFERDLAIYDRDATRQTLDQRTEELDAAKTQSANDEELLRDVAQERGELRSELETATAEVSLAYETGVVDGSAGGKSLVDGLQQELTVAQQILESTFCTRCMDADKELAAAQKTIEMLHDDLERTADGWEKASKELAALRDAGKELVEAVNESLDYQWRVGIPTISSLTRMGQWIKLEAVLAAYEALNEPK